MAYVYENLTDQRLEIPNVGVVEPHEEITSEQEINNPNLKLKGDNAEPAQPQAPAEPEPPAEPQQPENQPEHTEGATE